MNSATQNDVTAEELWRLPDDGTRRQLVRGRVVVEPLRGARHGGIVANVGSLIGRWAQCCGGVAAFSSGYILARNPDTVRGPDVSYVRPERIPPTGVPEAFWELAPDLAVEVVSPSDAAELIREKVREYLSAGTRLVWVIYPRSREVVAHTPDGLSQTFGAADTLASPDVLPGFSCKVAELFE
ncbi:MAG: Uma2 family endonuclease [Planctomycetia bacterium]|nr:Uma2 family endonuclease [Planctomycetia bacterium]